MAKDGELDLGEGELLARALKRWMELKGFTHRRAAAALGLSQRTVEYVAQGRGFRYPRLLALAMHETTDEKDSDLLRFWAGEPVRGVRRVRSVRAARTRAEEGTRATRGGKSVRKAAGKTVSRKRRLSS